MAYVIQHFVEEYFLLLLVYSIFGSVIVGKSKYHRQMLKTQRIKAKPEEHSCRAKAPQTEHSEKTSSWRNTGGFRIYRTQEGSKDMEKLYSRHREQSKPDTKRKQKQRH